MGHWLTDHSAAIRGWDVEYQRLRSIFEVATSNQRDAIKDLDFDNLSAVQRAVWNARPHKTGASERWVAVTDVFGYGSTTAIELCRRLGIDPYAKVPGVKCEACGCGGE
jgi:hypothetical protein